ncbi:hypothetical protein COW36_10235 [bacterium (Candidatus Blackallbacteria) CG17_big_fil_post_rev_8_21_14_2_50_48_46]|uniref:Glycosyltransferase 2-like domain-containing protein n=1 Tax=bacterium (Candidatus Blackallbacteria) CG17_big_fil_post_rev_8_21_14_2_50_48_46 TaxID=2014261 RepID=A0A2M7G530_9BACT|nr:MAG: hypothetical protein COW64_20005 [bacterium (Candidatus Blackallbacteria) CG18_big_fil_WC_8_21_14_2_50_49_26]PIW17011.1 MAG: hypothetical protein COW36_10235 [bacterium (Candidatus Blackallbacteria) CG17_big_fil_post_rev_8_21_14_2_50_48_46]PIW48181.1 MAG: hypothetical protein COW20_10440 [bacterium (Candidatus Blackallbacteria) CG13_big_fil_rev_8_21_14_2_50_49_14]
MQKQPLISVITPLYNYEKFIGGCIESVLAQTYPHVEMVIVDDESTDHSAEVVREYAQKYPQIHYIYQSGKKLGPWKMGVVPAINTAIQAAQGEYIAWLSADDLACPERLSHSLAVFTEQFPDDDRLAMVYADTYLEVHERECFDKVPLPLADVEKAFDTQGYVRWQSRDQDYGEGLLLQNFKNNVINGSTSLIRKCVFDEIGLFDSAYPLVHDYEMWMRMLLKGYRIQFLAEPLIISRIHTVNVPRWHACQQEAKQLIHKIWMDYALEELCLSPSAGSDERADFHSALGETFAEKRMFDLAISEFRRSMELSGRSDLYFDVYKQVVLSYLFPVYRLLRYGHRL